MCMQHHFPQALLSNQTELTLRSIQVNVPAESGEMGILSQHVPSIEQLKPGLVEIIEEAGGNKQFFREHVPSQTVVVKLIEF
jgi:ATP synthase, Delta/Epsilon chain, beta-sandwich domain